MQEKYCKIKDKERPHEPLGICIGMTAAGDFWQCSYYFKCYPHPEPQRKRFLSPIWDLYPLPNEKNFEDYKWEGKR